MEEATVTSLQGHEARESKQEITESVTVTENLPEKKKKRKPDNVGFHDSEFVKVRSLVKELRPFFVEVLHAHDFRKSKAASEIQKRMKTMIDLTKQLTETTSTSKPNEVHERPLHEADSKKSGDKKMKVEKQTTQPQQKEILVALSSTGIATKVKVDSKVMEKPRTEVSRGTFVVGGSPVGWNFLLYPGPKPVYYGRTKESLIASHASK